MRVRLWHKTPRREYHRGSPQDAGGELNGKRLELLKETLPNLSHVVILWNPGVASNRSLLTSMGDSAQGMGLTLVPVEAPGQDTFGQVFTTMMKERMEAFVILGDAVLFNYRGQIASGFRFQRNRRGGFASDLRC